MAIIRSPRKLEYQHGYLFPTEKMKKKQHSPLPARSLTAAPIFVTVGKAIEKFYIHEALLCASSDFLKKFLKPEWKTQAERTVAMPDTCPVAFGIYANWLYTTDFTIFKEDAIKQSPDQLKIAEAEWNKWGQCYELGCFVQDTDFTDALIDFAIERMSFDEECIEDLPKLIYPASAKSSPHRKLAVDIAIKVWLQVALNKVQNSGHTVDFLADLGIAFSSTEQRGGIKRVGIYNFFKDKDTCVYHEHSSSKTPCYKVKRGL